MWTALLDPYAPHAPFRRLWLTFSGLVEKDVLCDIMTITLGVDWGSLCGILGFFSLADPFWLEETAGGVAGSVTSTVYTTTAIKL